MKKQKKPSKLKRWVIAGIFIIIGIFIFGSLAAGYVISRITHVERVALMLDDLPAEFDGTTILYVSDVDMTGLSGYRSAAALFEKLGRLNPDILILGGDYANPSLFERINGSADASAMAEKRRKLFSALSDFRAPLGKFAVAGDNDPPDTLAEELSLGGIALLSDSAVRIRAGDASLVIAGLSDHSGGLTNYSALSANCAAKDCVVVAAHNPASITGILTAEAQDSGTWSDVILTGHTHGGQAVLAGRSLFKISSAEGRYGVGWSKESGVHVLVSEGLGCETLNFRLGTRSTAHLITLKQKSAILTFPEGEDN